MGANVAGASSSSSPAVALCSCSHTCIFPFLVSQVLFDDMQLLIATFSNSVSNSGLDFGKHVVDRWVAVKS
jgi:hypothetical protein